MSLSFYFKKKDKEGNVIPFNKQDKLLIGLSIKGAYQKIKAGIYPEWTKELNDRLNYELEVIINMGFSSYFLIVQDFLNFGRMCGHMLETDIQYLRENMVGMSIEEMMAYVDARQTEPGMTIGLGRGSGAGSLVTYLTGITSLDPIKNNLLFERFLNPERVSMPDIDSDLSKSEFEYGVRDLAIEYVKKKYGAAGICGITTPSTLAARAAIENVARAAGWEAASKRNLYVEEYDEDDEDEETKKPAKGNEESEKIRKYYLALGDKIKKYVPSAPGTTFDSIANEETGQTVDDILRDAFKDDADALNIIDIAESAEGVNINFGKHACGIIISDNGDVGAYAPLMMDLKADQLKIQLNAEQAEASGLLKMDFLGLKTLNIITKVLRLVYKNTGKSIDPLSDIDLEDKRVYEEIYTKALTNAVFQFESNGMKGMLKRFEPSCFADIVLLVACFRPGPLQYLDGIIARKHGEPAEESAVTKIASYYKPFDNIVKPTYYALVYQEQIMQAFRMVGYSMGGADNVRRAMGHKKMDVLIAEKQSFVYGNPEKGIAGAIACGIKEEDALELFEEMIDFAKYSFNKSHAAAYAMTSYITAWLKLYYPAEFYAAVLGFLNIDKIPPMIAEGKIMGLTFHGPDINKSENLATGEGKDVYLGFSGIKGIGGVDTSMRPFASIADFVIRSGAGDSMIDTLINVGAFDNMCNNRAAINAVTKGMYASRKKIKDKEKALVTMYAELEDLQNGIPLDRVKYKIKTKGLPTIDSLNKKIQTANTVIAEQKQSIRETIIPSTEIKEDLEERLALERELLGMYISGHPLDPYGVAADFGTTLISELTETEKFATTKIFGLITNLSIRQRKKDGANMAFFDLEDQSGSIHVSCFTNQYESYKDFLKENTAVILTGSVKVKAGSSSVTVNEDGEIEEAEVEYEFIISGKAPDAVKAVGKQKSTYRLDFNGIEEVNAIVAKLLPYAEDYGHKIIMFNRTTHEFGQLTTRVSSRAIEESGFEFKEL